MISDLVKSTFNVVGTGTLGTCENPTCKKEALVLRCSRCKEAIYCGKECQKADWQNHKIMCEQSEIGDFSDDDLKVLEYSRFEIEKIKEHLKNKYGKVFSKQLFSCFDFALLGAKERGVRECIFTPIGEKLSVKMVMEERLQRWGYEVVETPAEGDLVLYFDEKDLKHMGRYLKNGIVRSKFGNEVTRSSLHPVREICKKYGSEVVYYHKNLSKGGNYNEESVIKFEYRK